jgi:hypothetical protein
MGPWSFARGLRVGPQRLSGPAVGERDLTRDSDRALSQADREAKQELKSLFAEMGEELEAFVASKRKVPREPLVERVDSEAEFSQKLGVSLKADFLRHAGGKS